MNNFVSNSDSPNKVPRHLETLATTVFQSLFPPINPQTTPLKSIRRVLLLNREQSDDGTFVLSFRHYAITTKSTGLSRPLKRLNAAEKLLSARSRKGGVPNLGRLEDISDFMIGGENGEGYATDYTSGSEADTDAEVEVVDDAPRKVSHRRAEEEGADEDEDEGRVEKRAVKMVELGPRMKLRLTKVEDGLAGGKVMWHEYIHKTQEEAAETEKRWERKRAEKEKRRKDQKTNMEKKKADKKKAGKGDEEEDDDDEMVDYLSGTDADDFYNGGWSSAADEGQDEDDE